MRMSLLRVRVMNLHKAKGLEGKVVILAAPTRLTRHEVKVAVRRDGDVAKGGLRIAFTSGRSTTVLAEPDDWEAQAEAEQAFLDAEENRLLYVAATRAKDALVVARLVVTPKGKAPLLTSDSAWGQLQPSLEKHATGIALVPTSAPGRAQLAESGPSIVFRAITTEVARKEASTKGYALTTVSRIAHGDAQAYGERPRESGTDGGSGTSTGAAWGRAVHRMLEWLGHGGDVAELDAMAAAIAREEQLEAPPIT